MKPKSQSLIGLISILLFSFSQWIFANEAILNNAQRALEQKDYKQATVLFTKLSEDNHLKAQALYGLAQVAFYTDELDDAEDYIEDAINHTPHHPDYHFMAGRIAGKQAQSASVFTKLGYARDTKKFFSKALSIDESHKPSLIGLIRFHQQAPVMAGGEKEAIPELIEQLRNVDQRSAFSIEAPNLLADGNLELAFSRYREALKTDSSVDSGQFMFDFAMSLSNYGHYEAALKEILSMPKYNQIKETSYSSMILYQKGKLAAESKSHLDIGIQSIMDYAKLPKEKRTIPTEWVSFRLAQLQYLQSKNTANKEKLQLLAKSVSDKSLKKKIRSFLKNNQV